MKYNISTAIIGGTGVYNTQQIEVIDSIKVETAWGSPSDEIVIGRFTKNDKSIDIAFLPRHGKSHRILPSEIPQKANMAALKILGVKQIFAFSAVGSLKEEIAPRHFIIPTQIIDRTRNREDTFFGEGAVVHVSFGDPFCSRLNKTVEKAIRQTDITYHKNETMVCMEGPTFSTRAESKLYKSWGAGLINMTALPEAKFAKELEMCYQMICMSTDYDSWREEDEAVQSSDIMKVVTDNSKNAEKLLAQILKNIIEEKDIDCGCNHCVEQARMTPIEFIPKETINKLNTVLPKYFY